MNNDNFKLEIHHDQKLYEFQGLTYAYGIYAISKRVKPFCGLEKVAKRLTAWLFDNNGTFVGDNKFAYAVSHCQVEREPFAFFVVCDELVNYSRLKPTKQRNNKNFYFCAQEIYNPKILVATAKIKGKVPKRVMNPDGKGYKIVVEDGLVNNIIHVPSSDISFPYKKKITVPVYYRIKVEYQVSFFGFLITKREWVEGFKAHVFQHEIDLHNGKNIYYGKAKPE